MYHVTGPPRVQRVTAHQSIVQGSGPSCLACKYGAVCSIPSSCSLGKKFFLALLIEVDKGPQLLVRPYDPALRGERERPLYFPHSPLFGSAGALGTSAPRIRTRTRTRNRLRPELPESPSPLHPLHPLPTLPISGLRPGRVRFRTLPPYLADVTSRNGIDTRSSAKSGRRGSDTSATLPLFTTTTRTVLRLG